MLVPFKFLFFILFSIFNIFSLSISSSASSSLTTEQAFAFQAISQQFTRSVTMSGQFIQFHPNGQQSEGKFYIKRPGKVRFDYKEPSPLLVKSDGKTIGVHNRRLETWDYYPLRKTPLSLLLADRIDVSNDSVEEVIIDKELVTIVLSDRSLFGDSKIALMFDPLSYELRQWTVHDQQGKDTTVVLYNIEKDIELESSLFVLDRDNQ